MAAECGGVQHIELDYIYIHTYIYTFGCGGGASAWPLSAAASST